MQTALTINGVADAYNTQALTPTQLVNTLLKRNANYAGFKAVFISTPSPKELLSRAAWLEAQPDTQRGPLWGIPFAVKDNIDVSGTPTTAACPDFAFTPSAHAPVVQVLIAAGGGEVQWCTHDTHHAGGIFVGKTNMDQFACGLVGTRSPYGVPPNAFDARFVPGGSSSGGIV